MFSIITDIDFINDNIKLKLIGLISISVTIYNCNYNNQNRM